MPSETAGERGVGMFCFIFFLFSPCALVIFSHDVLAQSSSSISHVPFRACSVASIIVSNARLVVAATAAESTLVNVLLPLCFPSCRVWAHFIHRCTLAPAHRNHNCTLTFRHFAFFLSFSQAYTAWCNSQLRKRPELPLIDDMGNDLQDGVLVAKLIEILSKFLVLFFCFSVFFSVGKLSPS